MIRVPPAYVASDGSRSKRNQSATATKKTLNLSNVSTRMEMEGLKVCTYTEATEAKTGLVQVTSTSSAVIDTEDLVSIDGGMHDRFCFRYD